MAGWMSSSHDGKIPDEPLDVGRASAIKNASTGVTLVVATLLVIAKLTVWVLTGSMVLLASAIDALVDTGATSSP